MARLKLKAQAAGFLLVLALAGPAWAQPQGTGLSAAATSSEPLVLAALERPRDFGSGTLETVAGPGFCTDGPGVREPGSARVRSLAVHADGSFHFETGPERDPVLGQVDSQGRARVVRLALKSALASRSSALAPDGAGGVIVVAGDRLLHVDAQGAGVIALAPRFSSIQAVASDGAGRVFVADKIAGRAPFFKIQALTAAGIVQGQPVPAQKGSVSAIAASGDRLYFAGDRAIHMLNLSDKPITAHGLSVPAGGTIALGASSHPRVGAKVRGMGADGEGNLFVADESSDRVVRIDAAGRASVFAGAPRQVQIPAVVNGILATKARLSHPFDVKAGPDGRVYISDQFHDQVRFVDQNGLIQAAPGAGAGSVWTCKGPPGPKKSQKAPGTGAEGFPAGLAAGPKGSFYVISTFSSKVLRFGPEGRSQVVAGGAGRILEKPKSIASTSSGLYILEDDTFKVWFVNLSPRAIKANGVTVPAGSMGTVLENYRADKPGPYPPQSLRGQTAGDQFLAATPDGSLFIGDTKDRRILEVNKRGTLRTVAGQGGAQGVQDCCRRIGGMATDRSGNLYFSDGSNSRIWVLNRHASPIYVYGQTVAPGAIQPIAGNAAFDFRAENGDGGAAIQAQFRLPSAVALDGKGNLYITQENDSTIRRVDPSGMISTVAGSGTAGFNGDGLKGRLATLNVPGALAVDSCDNLLIADPINDRIRRLNVHGACPEGDSRSTRPPDLQNNGSRGIASVIILATAGVMIAAAVVGAAFGRRHRL